MSQPRKSDRAVIPSERAKNSDLNISKMIGASQMPITDDDTMMVNISMNETADESKMIEWGSDKEEFEKDVTITSTQKGNDEENKAEIHKLNEKIQLLESTKEKMDKEIKDLTDYDSGCTGCKSSNEKLMHMTEIYHATAAENAKKEKEMIKIKDENKKLKSEKNKRSKEIEDLKNEI